MSRVASFDEFRKNRVADQKEEQEHIIESSDENSGYYMFFRNLMSMKHYIEEIMALDPAKVEAMLSNGHDWASDHITSAKDDVAEVAEWIRTESEMAGGEESGEMEEESGDEETEEIDAEVEETDDDSEESEESEDND